MHRSRHILLILPLLFVMALAGCDNTFEPKTDFERRVVVFGALDPTAPYQVVRLEATYDAEVTNPSQPLDKLEITEAEVRIISDRGSVLLKDTVIALPDGGSRTVWIGRGITIREGLPYTLTVKVPDLATATAKAIVPSRSYVRTASGSGGILVAGLSGTVSPPGGFYFRLFVLAKKIVDGKEVEFRMEVPTAIDEATGAFSYNAPSRKTEQFYSNTAIETVRAILREELGVSARELVAVGYTLDNFLYGYYKAVRGFDDPVSVRQDMPDLSNVTGGAGVFGAMFIDSTRFLYSTGG